jgi:hypothetical protein
MGTEEKIDAILKLLEKLDSKFDILSARLSALEVSGASTARPSVSDAGDARNRSPSEMVLDNKIAETLPAGQEGRIKCPKCGAIGNALTQHEDKSKPISYLAGKPIFAKIWQCKKCGAEFQ